MASNQTGNTNIKISSEIEQHTRSSNPEDDKFLFLITPQNLAIDCCCGCSLKTGVQIISLIFIAASLSNFFTALKMDSLIDLISSGLSFILYFIAGVCILYSTMSNKSAYSHLGYFIFSIIFIFQILDNLVVFILILAGVYSPVASEDKFEVAVIYLLAVMLVMSLHMYMIWIIFCYSIHLKHKRYGLVSGYIYFRYEDEYSNRPAITQSQIPPQNY